MERKEIYNIIDGERDYQDTRWQSDTDQNKSIAEWLIYIEAHLNKAKNEVYHISPISAMEEIRKITALGVCAMEIHGCPERK